MTIPSHIVRRTLAERWTRAAPWLEVRGDALGSLAGTDGLERLNWFDGGIGRLRGHLAGPTDPAVVDRARATLVEGFARVDHALYQVEETGHPAWTLSVSPLEENRFAVAHTAWVGDALVLRVAETTALVVGSLLLDLATALPRLAPADRPPLDPPGSGRTAELPRDVFDDLVAGRLAGPGAFERAVQEGWDPLLAADLVDGFTPPVLSVDALAVAAVDEHRTAVETRRLWVGRSGWTWRAEQLIRPEGPDDHVDEVRLTHLGPDDAIRTVFEPLPWFTRWGRRT